MKQYLVQTAWIVLVALAETGGCPQDDDDADTPGTETPGTETPGPEESPGLETPGTATPGPEETPTATPGPTPVEVVGDLGVGEYVDMIGFQYGDPDGELTDVDVEFALLSPYEGFQTAVVHSIAFFPRTTASGGTVTGSIRTDELGGRVVHISAIGVAPGDIVLLGYSADGTLTPRPDFEESGWATLPLPTDSDAYPEEVADYLTLDGEGMEVTTDIQTFAHDIATSGTYPGTDTLKGFVCATVEIIDAFEYVSPITPTERALPSEGGTVSNSPNLADAQQVLEAESCICVECARLACAAFRSMNIPCRTASRLDPFNHTRHTWSQIFVDGFGWIDVDPQRGECPKVTSELYHLIDPTGDDASVSTFRTDPPTEFRILQPEELEAIVADESVEWGWIAP